MFTLLGVLTYLETKAEMHNGHGQWGAGAKQNF
jgi:hypothetical protein